MQAQSPKSKVQSLKPKAQRPKPVLYYAQNRALHKARAQLGFSLDDLRAKAGELNLGIASLSRLTLAQRHALLAELIRCGAQVQNPAITRYDAEEEARATGKLKRFPYVTVAQLKMLDALAALVQWREQDGYLRFCHTTIKAPAPRNGREVTTLRLALQSLITQQSSIPLTLPLSHTGRAHPGEGTSEPTHFMPLPSTGDDGRGKAKGKRQKDETPAMSLRSRV